MVSRRGVRVTNRRQRSSVAEEGSRRLWSVLILIGDVPMIPVKYRNPAKIKEMMTISSRLIG
jgi:hypothetical protein